MNEEMYRVTKTFKGTVVEATVTVSMRVQAYSHIGAGDIADGVINQHIFDDSDNWILLRVIIQTEEQIESGEFDES